MGIVMNRIPQLGKLSDNVWYCQGYSGHGVATSHIMGEIMAKAMSGEPGAVRHLRPLQHLRVPLGDLFGNPMLAAGMWYYQLMEAALKRVDGGVAEGLVGLLADPVE